MRWLFFFLLVIPLGTISFEHSYAQSSQGIVSITAQIVIQDSSGNLVSYLESERASVSNLWLLNEVIDKNPDVFSKTLVTNGGGQNFDLIKATDTITHTSATIVSSDLISTQVGKDTIILVTAFHDGYPVVAGDKVTTYWTILRTAS
jgi:hypothetical protein